MIQSLAQTAERLALGRAIMPIFLAGVANQVPVNQFAVEFNKLSKDKKEEGPAK